jgi:hypothetical protein
MKALVRRMAVALVTVAGMTALPMSAAATPAPATPALRATVTQPGPQARAGAVSDTVASSYHGVWRWDSYDGQPFASISLGAGGVSDVISVNFLNQGAGTWDGNTVMALWDGTDDGPPLTATQWCHAPGSDWLTCDPGIPAWDGLFPVGPGGSFTFQFQIQAPVTTRSFSKTLFWRPAEFINGSYQWIDMANGGRTYDFFTVFVAAVQ